MASKQQPVVSQQEIAKKAGVARTTVSLVLRGGHGLAPETIARVQQAAEALGYRPNRLVQGLRQGKTGLIGVMVPPHDSFWADVLYGIHDGLIERDHVPLILWSSHGSRGGEDEVRQVHRLVDWRVDGAILWPQFASTYQDQVEEFAKRDLPVVTLDCELPEVFKADAVTSDERLGARLVAELLLAHGHREILHVPGPQTETWASERWEAFAAELKSKCPEARVTRLEGLAKDVSCVNEIVSSLRERRATAVYAATDHLAEDVYVAASQLGWSVPEELSVVGYGNVNFGAYLRPRLTSVQQEPYAMGRASAMRVVDRVCGGEVWKREMIRLSVGLVERDSVGPVPMSSN